MPPKGEKQPAKKPKTRKGQSTQAKVPEAPTKEETPGKDTKEAANGIEVKYVCSAWDQTSNQGANRALVGQMT